jgi:hypothetical protein
MIGVGLAGRVFFPSPIAGLVAHTPGLIVGAGLLASAYGMWHARSWAPLALGGTIVLVLALVGVDLVRTRADYGAAGVAYFAAVVALWTAVWLYVRSRVRAISTQGRR